MCAAAYLARGTRLPLVKNPCLEPQSKCLNNPYRSRGFKARVGTTLFDHASIGSLLPGTTQVDTKPDENSAPAGLSHSEMLRATLYFLGETLSGAATFPREEEPLPRRCSLGCCHLPSREVTRGRRGAARAGEDGENGRGPHDGEDDGEGAQRRDSDDGEVACGPATMKKGGTQFDSRSRME